MDKNNIIPTLYNIAMIVATLALLMHLYPKVLGVTVMVLFAFYLSKVISSR